jgi:hypothetical protein
MQGLTSGPSRADRQALEDMIVGCRDRAPTVAARPQTMPDAGRSTTRSLVRDRRRGVLQRHRRAVEVLGDSPCMPVVVITTDLQFDHGRVVASLIVV